MLQSYSDNYIAILKRIANCMAMLKLQEIMYLLMEPTLQDTKQGQAEYARIILGIIGS